MKKFFLILLAVVVVFGGFVTVKNMSAKDAAAQISTETLAPKTLTAEAAADEETAAEVPADAEEAAAEEQPAAEEEAPKIVPDFDKLYALHAPEDVVLKVDGKDVTWGEYFYYLYNQIGRIFTTLQQMTMYYGYNASWDDPIDEEGTTVGEVACENAAAMYKQQLAIKGIAKDNNVELSEEDIAAINEEVDSYFTQILGEDATEEQKNEIIAQMYLTKEQFDDVNSISGLYARSFAELYGENGEKISDEEAQKYLEDNGYLCASHILLMTMDPATGEALDEETAAGKKTVAEGILEKLKAVEDQDEKVALFRELKDQYCEDTGKVAYPDGYLFTPGTMVPEFEDAVNALGEYEISELVETSYGYHIIMRLPLDVDMLTMEDVTARSLLAEERYSDEVKERIEAIELEFVNGYTDPRISDFVK